MLTNQKRRKEFKQSQYLSILAEDKYGPPSAENSRLGESPKITVQQNAKQLQSTIEDCSNDSSGAYLNDNNKFNQSSKTLLNTIDHGRSKANDESDTKSLVNKSINISKVIAFKSKIKGRPPISPDAKLMNQSVDYTTADKIPMLSIENLDGFIDMTKNARSIKGSAQAKNR